MTSTAPSSMSPQAGGLWCPFDHPTLASPDTIVTAMTGWASSFGLVTGETARDWLTRWQPEGLIGRVYPPCDGADLELAACWFAWLFIVDDSLDVDEPEDVAREVAPITDILNRDDPHLAGPGSPPMVRAVADLWQRTRAPMSTRWRARVAYDFTRCLEGAAWESANRKACRTPGFEAFHDARRWCGGTYFCLDLVERFQHYELTDAVAHSGPFEALRLFACDHIDWVNDVISCDREANRGDMHNIVMVLQDAHHLTRAEAIGRAVQLANERVRSFIGIEHDVLPGYLASTHLTARERDALLRAVSGLRNWMRGSLDWHLTTPRYRDHTCGGNPFAGASPARGSTR